MTRNLTVVIGRMIRADERVFFARVAALLIAACLVFGTVAPAGALVTGTDRIGGVPASERELAAAQMPDVDMRAGVLMTADGRELWARASSDKRAMASTTKIMTAVVVLESAGLDDLVRVSSKAAQTGESESGIRSGQTYSVRQLVSAMLVKSGNDASVALAEHVGGDVPSFVEKMNRKAQQLGLASTHFANPHGLDAEGHYTSAADLALLARYAMTKPEIREAVALETCDVGGKKLENSNQLIGTYTGANGVKTGWTSDAGYCVVASAQRGGVELYAIVLGTHTEAERFDEARKLFDWGFVHYRSQSLATSGTVVGTAEVSDYIDTSVRAVIATSAAATVLDLDGPVERKLVLAEEVRAPVSAGQRLGEMTFTQGDTLVARLPVVAARDVRAPEPLERVGIFFKRIWLSVAG